ncbi:MAG: hypothetical protein Q8P61_00435 [Candidatus Nanopelagicales bacterium]|nr:hypothetical protein [Candidatus Nanopelagicales bacterium]
MSSSKLPGSALYFFEEHREQYLHPSAGNECMVRVLADHEPSIATLWDSAMVATQFMEEGGGRVDPANAPLRLGIGVMTLTVLVSAGAFLGLLAAIMVGDLVGRLFLDHSATPVWMGVAMSVVFVGLVVGGAVAPVLVGRALLRRRRRAALRRYGDGDYGSLSYSSTST